MAVTSNGTLPSVLQTTSKHNELSEKDLEKEYALFLSPSFDANLFAHAIVNNEPYPPSSASDGASELSMPSILGGARLGSNSAGGAVGGNGEAMLNFGVEELNRLLKLEITKHHSSLLLQAASLSSISHDLTDVRRGLGEVESGVSRLRDRIAHPYTTLSSQLTLLTKLRRTTDLARRGHRFTVLARRLEVQMGEIDAAALAIAAASNSLAVGTNGQRRGSAGNISPGSGGSGSNTPSSMTVKEREGERRERAMAEAALTLAEIDLLLAPPETDPPTANANGGRSSSSSTSDDGEDEEDLDPEAPLPIRSLDAVESVVPLVAGFRHKVVEEMEMTVQRGLDSLDHPLLASSLQTAYNLSVLPSLVKSLMEDVEDLISRRISNVFDMASLGKEVQGKETPSGANTSAFGYKSRNRNEPTNVTIPQWTTVLWSRLEKLVGDLAGVCIKVYTLEKVLKMKKDQNTQMSFLDEAMSVLDNKPSLMFWTTLSSSFEKQAKDSVRTSTFIQTTLSSGYPRLLRLFQEFFSTISVHTDTVYTLAQQSPETTLVLRSIGPFETLYLTRSTNRLTEAVTSSFNITSSLSSSFSSRPPSVPGPNEGLAVARAIVNELDAARFDPLLVKAVAKGAAKAVEAFVGRADSLVAHDHSSTSTLGPLATPSQHSNSSIGGALYHLWSPLHRAISEHSESVRETLKPAVDNTRSLYLSISNPLIMAIRREFSSIITRMHRVDYSKKVDTNPMSATSSSSYMVDLVEKLGFVRDELLGLFKVGDLAKDWALDLARFTVQTFVLHASIVRSLGESGKLKLTSDTTTLEFAISQYLSSHHLALSSMGDQFKALRAFRPLLFLTNDQLASPQHTNDVPTLILLHHILSRSDTLKLPHLVHGWTEAEYVRWLNEHGEAERMKLVEGVLEKWEKEGRVAVSDEKRERGDNEVKLLREVLRARGAV
ncbi:hypothetical protein T439DRAFT_325092 [Meredithblackwellia eburnea MCA 4105]